MVTKVTSGIKISVNTTFEGIFYKNFKLLYSYNYEITIENQSKDLVQLNSRYWEIYDSLNFTEVIEGEGVVGKKPIIKPGDKYVYNSGCLLTSTIGAMSGFYHMINLSNSKVFQVEIPIFKLNAPFALN